METASQLQERAPMGGPEEALASGVVRHLVLEGPEILVSLSSLSLALLSPGDNRAATPSPSFEQALPSLTDQCASLPDQPPPRCYRMPTPIPGSSTLPAGITTGHCYHTRARSMTPMGVDGFWGRHMVSFFCLQPPPRFPAYCLTVAVAACGGSSCSAIGKRQLQGRANLPSPLCPCLGHG